MELDDCVKKRLRVEAARERLLEMPLESSRRILIELVRLANGEAIGVDPVEFTLWV